MLLRTLPQAGDTAYQQGEIAAAERLMEECLAGCRATVGPDHELTREVVGSLGFIRTRLGKLAEAEPLLVEALEAQRRLDPDSSAIVPMSLNLAMFHMAQGQFAKSEPLLDQAVEAGTRLLGAEHPHTPQAIATLGAERNSAGRFGEAAPFLARALEAQERILGATHPNTLTTRANLGFAHLNLGELDAAAPLVEGAHRDRAATLGETHPHTLHSCLNLAALRRRQGDVQEVERLLLDGERLCRPGGPGANPVVHAKFARALAEHFELAGDARAASEWRKAAP